MSLSEYLVGAAFFVVSLGGVSLAAALIVRRRFGHYVAAERVLAFGVLGTVGAIAIYLVPGLVGLLSRGAAALLGVLLAIGAFRIPVRPGSRSEAADPWPTSWARPSARLTAIAALTIIGIELLAYIREHATHAVTFVDSLTFHLPVVARWIQTGSVWPVHEFVPYLGQGNYPQSGDLVTLAVVAPWRNDAFQRFAMVPFLALAALAVFALARALNAPRWAATVFGIAAFAGPDALLEGVSLSLPDAVMLAMFGAGLVFLIRHWRTRARPDLLLAGLALGVAFGTKWYGVSSVVAVAALWGCASVWARRPAARIASDAAALGTLVALTGGFWLVRNIVESGTPFFPGGWLPVGVHPAQALGGHVGPPVDFTIAHYALDAHVWGAYILPGLFNAFRWPGVILLAGGAASAALLILGRGGWRRGDRLVWGALAATFTLAVVYTLTPDTAVGPPGQPQLVGPQARYLLPAVLPLAAVTAWAVGRLGRWGILGAGAAVIAISDSCQRTLAPSIVDLAGAGAALLSVVLLCWSGWRKSEFRRQPLAVASAATLAVLAAVAGQPVQRRFNAHRYQGFDPTVEWVRDHAPAAQRIGLAGTWSASGPSPIYPAFGPRLRNQVEYVGPTVSGALERYRDEASFTAALRRRRYDLLLIGLGDPPTGSTVEESWARSVGYMPVAVSRWLALYRAPASAL